MTTAIQSVCDKIYTQLTAIMMCSVMTLLTWVLDSIVRWRTTDTWAADIHSLVHPTLIFMTSTVTCMAIHLSCIHSTIRQGHDPAFYGFMLSVALGIGTFAALLALFKNIDSSDEVEVATYFGFAVSTLWTTKFIQNVRTKKFRRLLKPYRKPRKRRTPSTSRFG